MTLGRVFLVLLLSALIAVGVFAARRFEDDPPTISIDAPQRPIGASGAQLQLRVRDAGSGLSSIEVTLLQGDNRISLRTEHVPTTLLRGSSQTESTMVIAVDPQATGMSSGEATLQIDVHDASLRNRFAGNAVRRKIPLQFDLDPPQIWVESGLTYIRQGGSAAVRYRVSEPTRRDGVQIGKHFFSGVPQGPRNSLERVALFGFPATEKATTPIHVIATDLAGNETAGSWPVRVQATALKEEVIDLPPSFLQNKVLALAGKTGVTEKDPVAAFQQINQRVRAENEASIRSKLVHTAKPLWHGAFQQWPGSRVMSVFGEHRKYRVDGRFVSEAIHSGYDLAKTAGAPVPAANSGVIIFAGPMGIYGNCVLVDHGLGLTSLYGHMSLIDVHKGDAVTKGSVLGRSGATGLAGGDHLHFALLLGDTYVTPLEWWDAHWVRTHIDPALTAANPSTAQ